MTKKKIVIIVVVIIVLIISIFGFSRKPEVKYTTVKVEKGVVLQTVSATGTAEAATKLDLRFVNSGKIEQINVKVGDKVESEMVLAQLDTDQLKSQFARSKASLSAANANYNKLIMGATAEDLQISRTAVDNAQIALDSAGQNLTDVQISGQKDIDNANSSVNSAQVTLDNANLSLENTKISNENNLNQDYDDAWDVVNSSLLTVFDALNTNKTTLEYEDAQDTLSVLNKQYLNYSSQSKIVADNSYNNAKDFIDSIRDNQSFTNIDEALLKTKNSLEDTRDTLSDTGNVLGSTITSSQLSQTELDSLKASISTSRTSVNTAITNITTAQQNISTQKVTNQTNLNNSEATVNSATSSLSVANNSLFAIESSVNTKINSAQNAIKSAEGALKQAQDQLAFKMAGPSSSDVQLYRAQVQEAQASVDMIQSQIDDSVLRAPRNGIITVINGEVGEAVNSTMTFISLITDENFEITANISEVDISKVKIDDKVEITFDALGPDEEFEGIVVSVDPAETEISGVIYYKLTTMFAGDGKVIKPGMTANLDILTARKDDVVMIPFQALKDRDGQKFVQVLEGDVARDIFVEVGLRGDIDLEITSGLQEGQDVVTFAEE
ncbi:MAG: efflux RND transporter periplasmic adaptor subunit [Candidatus Pacebacteria bacterium]|nr:efflux RND transporter periplasmic adaptor subunit [Candidatus Paceibacterota bacterium]